MSKVKEYYLEEEYNPIEAIDKLQQENTKLRIQISAREEEYIKLQEENKKLKELCNKYEEEHSTTFQIWKYNKDTYKEENERLNNIIKEVRKYINKHCVNEKVSKEVGYKCYTMADTNELEYIMKKLGDDYE